MLLRTCLMLLLLALLSAATSLDFRAAAIRGTRKSSASASLGGPLSSHQQRTAAKHRLDKSQGTQRRQTILRPSRQRMPYANNNQVVQTPWRNPPYKAQDTQYSQATEGTAQQQVSEANENQWAKIARDYPYYVIYYPYPPPPPGYQDQSVNQPFRLANNGIICSSRILRQKVRLPTSSDDARNDTSHISKNKIYGPQSGYPGAYVLPNVARQMCPPYLPINGNAPIPVRPGPIADGNYPIPMWQTDGNEQFGDAGSAALNLPFPYSGQMPPLYNSAYDSGQMPPFYNSAYDGGQMPPLYSSAFESPESAPENVYQQDNSMIPARSVFPPSLPFSPSGGASNNPFMPPQVSSTFVGPSMPSQLPSTFVQQSQSRTKDKLELTTDTKASNQT